MQFSCDSCKTALQIADEKVRGKRLVVRCKRCGAKITISDPAWGGAARSAPPRPAPAPIERPQPDPPATQGQEEDSETTRAMETDVLQRALDASKRDALEAPAAPPPPAAPADAPLWFAMIAGKQAGPLTRAELIQRAAQGSVGARTYLWKEGMDSWQRAKDVPEMADLFPAASAPTAPAAVGVPTSAPPPSRPPSQLAGPEAPRTHEQVAKELFPTGEYPAQNAADLARWASEEMGKHKASAPGPPQAARTAPAILAGGSRDAPPNTHLWLAVTIGAAIALAVALWSWFGSMRGDSPGRRATSAASPAATPGHPLPAGLSPEEVRRRVDDNRQALQGCVDDALEREPSLRVGTIHISASIAPDGSVKEARIDRGSVDESPLGACLKRATRQMAFPAFGGEPFDVDIPLVVTASN